jgi:hypothetical protein
LRELSRFLFVVLLLARRTPTRSGDGAAYATLRRRKPWSGEKLQSLESLDYEVIDNKR